MNHSADQAEPPSFRARVSSSARHVLRALPWALIVPMVAAPPLCAADLAGGASVAQQAHTIAVNTHYGAPRGALDGEALRKLADAGVDAIRNDLDWASIEKVPGVYDFETPGIDALVEAAEAAGLRIIFILDYGNDLHGPRQAVVDDGGRRAFAAWAAAAVSRYGGRGHRWEIWNEPNLPQFWNAPGQGPSPEQYARLVEAAVPAIRAADASAEILIGSAFMGLSDLVPIIGGIPGRAFLARLFASGVLDRVDGVTAHFYRAEAPETVAADVAEIRRLMAEAGTSRPLWSGEWGYSTYDPDAPPSGVNYLPAVSEGRQASYVARMLLTNRSLGLAGSVYFKDRDADDPSPGNIEHHFGLMRGDLAAKPSYAALATAADVMGGAEVVERLPLDGGGHGLSFEGAAGRVTALWSEEEAILWRFRSADPSATLLSRDGSDLDTRRLARGVQVRSAGDDGPIYARGEVEILPPSDCPGDCDGDGRVTIDELVEGVGAVVNRAASRCPTLDRDGDGAIRVDELVTALRRALGSCPASDDDQARSCQSP